MMNDVTAFVRSLIFVLVYNAVGILLILTAFAAALMGQNAAIWGARNWALWHRLCARVLLGIRPDIKGSLDQGQALYVFKHESMYEAVATLALFKRPIVVMKQELLDLFAWGYSAKIHGSIGVDRDAGATAMRRMVASARTAKASGRPIILFPEGTRVPHGDQPDLKAGLAGLYKILGLPVIPVAHDAGRVWPRGFVKRPGIVTFKVGAPIPPGLPRDEIEMRVHKAINLLNTTKGTIHD
jgi:1-acyl-sn-glycerol-3-phosphate acyltransferase